MQNINTRYIIEYFGLGPLQLMVFQWNIKDVSSVYFDYIPLTIYDCTQGFVY